MLSRFQKLSRVPFVRDLATMQMGQMVTILASFLSSVLVYRLLGIRNFGEFGLIGAFAGTLGIVTNLGQQPTTLTFLSQAYGRGSREDMRDVLHYFMVMSIVTTGFLILLAAAAPGISSLMYGDPSIGNIARLVFLASIIDQLYNYVSIILQTVRDIRLMTIVEKANNVLQLGLSILLLLLGFGVIGMFWASLGASVCFFVLSFFLHRRIRRQYDLPGLWESLRHGSFARFGFYARQSIWITIDKNLGNLYPNVFLLILGKRTSIQVVGLFKLAFSLAGMPASFVLSNISRLANSVIPNLAGKGQEVLRKSLRKLLSYAIAVHFVVSLGAAICVPIFLPYVYGPSSSVAAYPFLVILTLNLSLAVHAVITPILRVYGKINIAAQLNLNATLVAVPLFFILDNYLPATIALYGSLIAYHIIIALVFIPALRFLQQAAVPAA